jgi:hypothetical protein
MASIARSIQKTRTLSSVIALTQHMQRDAGSNLTRRLFHLTAIARSQAVNDKKDVHHPSELDKKILVWTKKYASADDIPKYVTQSEMKKARDFMRIRVNIGMVFATVLGCIWMIISGRRMRDSGDSLAKRGAEWEKEMKELGRREREAAATAAANKS